MTKSNDEGLTMLGALLELKEDIKKMQTMNQDSSEAMFVIEEGELELKLIYKKSATVGTKFKLYVFNSDLHGDISTESIQTLKIKFRGISAKKCGSHLGFGDPKPDREIEGPIVGVDGENLPHG